MAAPNESRFQQNTRSPRFTTSKALGFEGGSTDPSTGNLVPPSYQQVSGLNVAPPIPPAPIGTGANAISQFRVPQSPGIGQTLLTSAGGAVAGEVAKQGLKKGANAIGTAVGNYFKPSGTQIAPSGEGFSSSSTLNQSFPGTQNMSVDPTLAGTKTFSGEFGIPQPGPVGSALNAGEFSDAGSQVAGAGLDQVAGAGLDQAAGAGLDQVAGAGIDAASNGIPFVGPLSRAAQGDISGAAGSAFGAIAGNAIFPGIGGIVGGAIGGALGGGCFITEAVMSSGGQDNGMELEALRGFRDNILMKTPQGQAMVAEYEAIAPVVVECVSQRPDGIQIFQHIKSQFIDPAVQAVNAGDFQSALQIYANMIGFVTPFAAEAAEAGMGGGDQDQMNQMGDHAAMIGNSPEMAGQAMPGGDDDAMMGAGGMGPTGGPPPMQQGGMQQQQQPMQGMMPQQQPVAAAPGSSQAQWGPRAPAPAIGQTFAKRY